MGQLFLLQSQISFFVKNICPLLRGSTIHKHTISKFFHILFFSPSFPFKILYLAYIFSCFCDQLWGFAIIFMLENLGGMRLVGLSQLIENILQVIGSAFVGSWMNKRSRLHATLTVLAVNNIAVAISATLLIVCMVVVKSNTVLYAVCLGLSMLFGGLSKCASEGEKMSFTKDWIVVMSQREGENTLSRKFDYKNNLC